MMDNKLDKYLPELSIADIYEHCQDDESREIFMWRYQYFITRNREELINTFCGDNGNGINRYNRQRSSSVWNHVDISPYSSGVILFGAGGLCFDYIAIFNLLNIEIRAICDTFAGGKQIGGYNILTIDEALKKRAGSPIIITPDNKQTRNDIENVLLAKGVPHNSIHTHATVSYFTDEEQEIYFNPDILLPMPDEIYIDAGCYDGETILQFCEFSKKYEYKRIYGFEPDSINFKSTLTAIENCKLKNVTLLNKGLWNSADVLNFNNLGNGRSGILDSGEAHIETVTLNDAIDPDDRVTFIKMDIQGAELNGLVGGDRIIARDKPRLAISVYHKPEDIIFIASQILSANSDYKLFLRHHSALTVNETVLYAV